MAQLPFLIYEQKPPMSSDAFKNLAESLLTEDDAVLFRKFSLDPYMDANEGGFNAESAPLTGFAFFDSWRDWERTLRLNLAKHRAVHVKRESITAFEPPLMPADASSVAARVVGSDSTPLEGEILIDKARWNAIDIFAGIDNFALENIFAYYLKLLLLERRQVFNADRGLSEYKSLYAEIIQSVYNSPGEIK
jgi:hypothetical protein